MKRVDPLLGLVEDFPPRTGTARLLSSQAVPVRFLSIVGAFPADPRESRISRLGPEPCAPLALRTRVYPAAAAKTGRDGTPRVIKNDARTYGSAVTLGVPSYGGAA